MRPPDDLASGAALFTVVRGGDLYAPRHLGRQTVVISGQKIVWLGEDNDLPPPSRCRGTFQLELDSLVILPRGYDEQACQPRRARSSPSSIATNPSAMRA